MTGAVDFDRPPLLRLEVLAELDRRNTPESELVIHLEPVYKGAVYRERNQTTRFIVL